MKTIGVVILGLILLAVIIVMIVVEIIELAVGAVLLLVALGIIWWLWRKVKSRFE
ncbi:hypothetical protein ACXYMT_03035 [Salinimicrobium sp. CAU 1759]